MIHEEAQATIWCRPNDLAQIRTRIEAEIKDIIWSDKIPVILPSITNNNFEMFHVKLLHGGDIIDDSILSTMLVKISSYFNDCFVRFDVTEGDLFLIESASQLNDDIDIEEGCSIAYKNELFRISEDYAKANTAPQMVKEENKYPEEIQYYFQAFLKEAANQKLYHTIKLMIPKPLKRLLKSDATKITLVTQNAKYKTSIKGNIELVTSFVKFRRSQLALLDSNPIRIDQTFLLKCKGMDPRNIRLSYLLCCAYENMLQNENHSKTFQQISSKEFDYLDNNENDIKEDTDYSWLDNVEPPQFTYEDIGSEMAERFSAFVKEISEFDKIDDEGPINFNFESFSNKLEHFLDSSESEEEVDAEEDIIEQLEDEQFAEMIKEDEDKHLNEIASGNGNAVTYATALFNGSLQSETSNDGPTSHYLNLFGLNKE